mgnify:CR=1 FL=1
MGLDIEEELGRLRYMRKKLNQKVSELDTSAKDVEKIRVSAETANAYAKSVDVQIGIEQLMGGLLTIDPDEEVKTLRYMRTKLVRRFSELDNITASTEKDQAAAAITSANATLLEVQVKLEQLL